MGVLDDAIREHLDLKRRHGAAEEELRRQEAEALGPARREVAPAESEDGEPNGNHAPAEVEPTPADEPELAEAIAAEASELHGPPDEPEALLEEAPAELHEPEALSEEAPAELDEEPAVASAEATFEEPEPVARADLAFDEPEQDHRGRVPGETPQQGFEHVEPEHLEDDEEQEDEEEVRDEEEQEDDELPAADDALLGDDDDLPEDDDGHADPDEDADLLEDTPDFLQETPEHDRLWFEQKPPRDFDFD